MKQLDLFSSFSSTDKDISSPHSSPLEKVSDIWQIFIDGAARNNPGPAGVGIYMLKNGQPFARKGFFLGSKTNNQAEYAALLIGLVLVKEHMNQDDALTIVSDSELLVKQIQGLYKVKQPELQKLHAQALVLLKSLKYVIRHVMRSENPVADELANHGIDKKIPLPAVIAEKLVL
jgi:ribonuclease HI